MKQSLNLRLGHKLKLTPRLQQAIALLQLSSMDLEVEIRQALENNPFLEETEGPAPGIGSTGDDGSSNDAERRDAEAPGDDFDAGGDGEDVRDAEPTRDILPPSAPTRDSYDNSTLLDNLTGGATIAEFLHDQVRISPLDERQSLIARAIIENIDDDGYLVATLDELSELLSLVGTFDTAEIEAVLRLVQSMDPPGIAARDLRECLLLQLENPEDDPARARARRILEDGFDALSRRDFGSLRRTFSLREDELAEALVVIRSLDPRPGAQLDRSMPPHVVPDLVVRRGEDGWQVMLNEDAHSKLAISPSSRTYLSADSNREDTLYFRQRYQEAKWFLQSLKQRNETITRVAREIMRHQSGFLEHGEREMKPLTLRQVAEVLDLHESTVSRATSGKYILSPRGTHELKYFFSSQLATDQGDALSSTAIQAQIRALISREPGNKPISDQKIADHFKSKGVTVARRTVAKYREQMHIPPSSQRKGIL